MGDLSSSEEWWQAMVEAAKAWYMSHMGKTPLERLQHHPMPPPMLTQKKWARLERRAASLLLAAIPEGLREEVVSSRSLSTLGILTKGMIQYQPGGLAEKSAILAALESPQEAQSIASGVTTLRRWLRWKRRAEDLGVSIPDATILVRGEWKCQRNGITKQVDMYGSFPSHPTLKIFSMQVKTSQSQGRSPSPETKPAWSRVKICQRPRSGRRRKWWENCYGWTRTRHDSSQEWDQAS